jgi:hypothetical protein
MHGGLPCSKKKLASAKLHEVVPPSSTAMAFFSCEKPPAMIGLHAMMINKGFEQDFDLNHSIQVLQICFIFFFDRS